MSDPNQAPPPNPNDIEDVEMAKAAGTGCLAGLGVVGLTLVTIVLVIVGLAIVGVFLLYLACSVH